MVPSGSEMSLVFADRVLPSAGVPVMEREPVAPSSTLATLITKVSLTEALEPSVAVTFTEMEPTSPFRGVPLKVRVWELKLSQDGRAAPPARVAV